MDTVKASESWSPQTDVYRLYAEPPAARWVAEPCEGTPLLAVLLELDEQEQETGRIAGVEIVGFSDFDRWESIPSLQVHWQLPGWAPLPLRSLLKRRQRELRRRQVA